MREKIIITVLMASAFALGGCAENKPKLEGLAVLQDVPLPGGANRFDYQSHDAAMRRLYIAHMGSNALIVYDTAKDEVVANVEDIGRPTGVLAVPEMGRVYVSDSRRNKLVVVDQKTNEIIARVPTGGFPDGVAYDPKTKRIFVSDESGCSDTVIDATTNEVVATIDIGGEAGNTQYDSVTGLMYVNVQTRNQLVAMDPATAKIVGRYDLEGAAHNHGLSILADQRLAMIACQGKSTMLIFDLETHEVIGSEAIGAGADVLAFDPETKLLYIAAESGPVAVFAVKERRVRRLALLDVDSRAHSVSIDPKTHRVYFPLESVEGRPVLRICESFQGS